MKKLINSCFINDKRKVLLAFIITLIVFLSLGVSYAFFKPFIGPNTKTHLDVESYNTDQLTFTKGEDITINAEQQNFGPNMGDLSAETVGVAKLVANKYTKQATQYYNVYFDVYENGYSYSVDSSTPELILTVIDPSGNELTSIEGINYVTVGDVSGFDITTLKGYITIAKDYEISTTSTTDGTIQTWKFKLTYVNLDYDQRVNEGKVFRSELLLQQGNYSPAIAVYSETDNSLRFYKRADSIVQGEVYNGLMTTAVYRGMENTDFEHGSMEEDTECNIPWMEYFENILSVSVEDEIIPLSTKNWFNALWNTDDFNLEKLDTSKVNDMSGMFRAVCSNLDDCKITGLEYLDTSNVKNMSGMFNDTGYTATNVELIIPESWDTSKVTDMSEMFFYTGDRSSSFNLVIPETFDTSQVTNMANMFACTGGSNTNITGIENLDVSNVKNMAGMFYGNFRPMSIPATWNTSKVTSMSGMFYNNYSVTGLENLNVSNVTNMSHMFEIVKMGIEIPESWDTSKVTDMTSMFSGICSPDSPCSLDLTNLNTSSVVDMRHIFHSSYLTDLNVSNWDTSKVEDMSSSFYNISNITVVDISSWNFSNLDLDISFGGVNSMFKYYGESSLQKVYVGNELGYSLLVDETYGSEIAREKVYLNIPYDVENDGVIDGYVFANDVEGDLIFTGENGVSYKDIDSDDVYEIYISSYTVSFDANGGTGTMGAQAFQKDVAQNIKANTFTKTGYNFLGWSTSASGSVEYTNEQSITDFGKFVESFTLYAVWNPNTYKVAYNANGGTGTMSTLTHTYDTSKTLTANAFARTGYTFAGWNTSADGSGTSYANKASVKNLTSTSGATVTLYAQWTAKTYKVAYNANGGSGTMSTITHTYDVSKALTANTFTRTGYTFAGWNTSTDGSGTSYANKASVKNLSSTSGATVTLYAQWTATTYKVAFNANGGSGTMTAQTFTYDVAQNLTANTFTRTNYSFAGWATSASGSVKYTNKQSLKNLKSDSSTLTLYAVWNLTTTSWTYTSNGTFTVPKTGTYTIELHGGGGGGSGYLLVYKTGISNIVSGAGGGGSGQKYTTTLTLNTSYSIKIGAGGAAGETKNYTHNSDQNLTFNANSGSSGGTTSFGSLYSVSGGSGGGAGKIQFQGSRAIVYTGDGGTGSGSLASAGGDGSPSTKAGAGGSGGSTVGTYGTGGTGGSNSADATAGKPGAVIIKYVE